MKYPLFAAFSLFVAIKSSAQEIIRPIQLKSGTLTRFKNLRNESHLTDSLLKYRFRSKCYAMLQFTQLPDAAERQALAREGILLYDYIPDNTFLAEITDKVSPALLKKNSIGGVYTLNAKNKISSTLKKELSASLPDPDKLIAVSFYGHLDKATAIAELKQAGAQIAETKIQPAHVVFVKASATVVEKIAALPFVAYVSSQHIKPVPLNFNNRAAHSINILSAASGRNLHGSGVVLGIGDDGDASAHIDFAGRVINRNPIANGGHATLTMGCMGGAGILNPRYKGMAPKATMIGQYFSDIIVNTPFYVADFGMVVTNNSYASAANGCAGQGDYDVLSRYVDDLASAYPSLLQVFAAGNDGGYTCSPFPQAYGNIKSGFQTGKNVLTVGGISTSNFSNIFSRGPVDDGRLKPEIVAGGDAIGTTAINNSYTTQWGTSLASPAVAGSVALLYERYRQLHGGANPTAALIKAVTCNGADDLGNPGPDFTYGFGSLNTLNAVEALENHTYFNATANQGSSQTFTITGVPAGTAQVKILLYWNDPSGTPYAASALVNNLDLAVTAPDATIHRSLILNPAATNVTDVAVEGLDSRNNIEQVVINNPPAGDFTVRVNGTNVPQGPQDYVVAYQVIAPTITVTYPSGEETLVTGENEFIRWSAFDGSANTFTIEYSTDNGGNWTTIDNSVPGSSRVYYWSVPATATNAALIRVTRNGTGTSDVSDHSFAVMGQPTVQVDDTCVGYAYMSWTAVPSATSYDVMMLKGSEMSVVANTTGTGYMLEGLNKDSTYWLTVRPLIGAIPGRRAIAKSIIPSGGPCPSPDFDNDIAADLLVAPVTGRQHTLSQLGTAAPQFRIRNIGTITATGTFNITYQVNGGTPVTEVIAQSITANSTYTHTFASTYDFSATGTYTVKAWVDFGSDTKKLNDTLVTIVKHLQNDPITLSPSFTEGFESAVVQSYATGTRGFNGLDRCDFFAGSSNGRARTFVNSGIARTGNRAITLDQKANLGILQADSLITTFNLANYNASHQLWLSFYYQNQGIDFTAANNRVWIRGSENDAWVQVFTLPTNAAEFGVYRAVPPVNITETLANAVPAQTVSSSFQIKFGEHGYRSTNSVIVNGNLDDGYTFDDITITLTNDDLTLVQLQAPATNNVCALSGTEPVTIQVKNYSANTLTNVPVSYQVDNGPVVTESIPSIAGGQTINYTFTQTANLSAFKQYTLTTYVHLATDNYRVNDTITTSFRTKPLITSFPYHEGFENNEGDWYTGGINSSWEWGAPAGTIINKAANGTNAWVTNLNGNHNNNEQSYLYSPCFDLTGLTQPVLSFSHIYRTEDNCTCDLHWVEYSTDGVSWTKLGSTSGGTNWYDNVPFQVWRFSNTRWHVTSHNIPTSLTGPVRFRIVFFSDPGVTYEGVGIDDIHIFDRAAIYSGSNVTSGLTQPVSGNNWIHFTSGGNRIASINPHGQDLGNTEVKVYINGGTIRNDGSQYYLDRNIVIQPANAPASPVSVRFYFLNTEANKLITATGCGTCTTISDAFAAGITQYSGLPAEENGSLADNASGVPSFITPSNVQVIPYDNGYYAEYQVNSFSEFWINGGGPSHTQPLPIVLGQFTVTKNNKAALLQWTTLQETNTSRFIIEKSIDGSSYTAIGTVAAAGNSGSVKKYQFTDAEMANGINYYRIKTIDKDAKSSLSPVRSLNNADNDLTITLQPNPATKGVVTINSSVNSNRIELRDAVGRLIKTMSVTGMQHTLPVDQLNKGLYFVTVITDSGSKIEKLFVE
ncbi:S8 family serine peptidase [Longitalea luteola]|uniref:S8 family serine peptidase n=1 Tax=Longitalea luteola TaxID=2812563 RepID=UPI001A977A63|nr:S8 family serine peptidase [Longitalea luteola]